MEENYIIPPQKSENVGLLKENEKPCITAELLCLTSYPLDEWEEWLDKEDEAAD
ncbi:MAG: hypothetical protein H8D63_02525 [Parcubacteria group bacterium]|nr:hypothetical protein [Parcubacteria group bacterium]